MRWGLLAGALLLAMGSAAAGAPEPDAETTEAAPVPVTLWFHVNGFQEFPINTQKPDDRYAHSASWGAAANTVGCVDGLTGVGEQVPLLAGEYHTMRGYLSPSYVQYDVEDGKPRIHQERGILHDVVVVGDTMVLHWMLETQAVSGDPPAPANSVPVGVPNVVVQATLRSGDAISVGNEAYDAGEVLAAGHAGPFTLAGASTSSGVGNASGSVSYQTYQGRHVYDFTVPLRVERPTIGSAHGANLRIDVYAENPACRDDGHVMPNLVRTHSSPTLRPRMELTAQPTLRVEGASLWLDDSGRAHTHAVVTSAFGNHDVANRSLTLEGPSGAVALEPGQPQPYVHGQPHDPYAVEHSSAAPLAPGTYTLTVRATNLAGTERGEATAVLTVDGDAAAPGWSLVLLGGGVLGVALAVRRRAAGPPA